MIRVYARENATQRGHTSTALAGTVASALKFCIRALFLGRYPVAPGKEKVPPHGGTSQKFAQAQTSLRSGTGIGENTLLEFLDRIGFFIFPVPEVPIT